MKLLIALFIAASGLVLSPSLNAQSSATVAAPASADANMAGGKAVYYSDKFNGRKTYSGARFSNKAMVAAHRTLPMGTMVRVTNLKNKKSVTVKIIDRGPSQPERVIDLSKAAANKLDFVKAGSTDVSLQVVGKAKASKVKKG
jgi:rare lipoprotein A